MIELTDKEKIERLILFYNAKTYTYIKKYDGYFLNGFISNIDNDTIKFKDDVLGEIPIYIKEISEINYSIKNKGDLK